MKKMSMVLLGVAAVMAFMACGGGGGGGGGVADGIGGGAPGKDPLYLNGNMALFFETDSPSQMANFGGGDYGTSYGRTVIGFVPAIPFAAPVTSRSETDSDSPWAFNQYDFSSTVIYPLTVGGRLFVVRTFTSSNQTTTTDILEYRYDALQRGFTYLGSAASGIVGHWAIAGNKVYFLKYANSTWYVQSRFLGSSFTSTSPALTMVPGLLYGVGNTLVSYIAPGNVTYTPGFYRINPDTGVVTTITTTTTKLPPTSTTSVYAGSSGLYWTNVSWESMVNAFTISRIDLSGNLTSLQVSLGYWQKVTAVTLDEENGMMLATVVGPWVSSSGDRGVKNAYLISGMNAVVPVSVSPFTVGQFTQVGCQFMYMP